MLNIKIPFSKTGFLCKIFRHYSGSFETSTQSMLPDNSKSSSGVNSIAEFELPHAGKTVEKRLKDSSQKTFTQSFSIPKGQTPPILCPVNSTTSSGVSILAFSPKVWRNFLLSILASPAAQTRIHPLSVLKESVLQILAPSVFKALAASSTVALDTENSKISPSRPKFLKYSFTFSILI